ncbi:MAG: spore coat associated protein CotJA [Eubacteriales bacterium]
MQNYRMSEPIMQSSGIDKYPVAMAYVPWQNLTEVYQNLQEAFNAGTIFPELNKPFTGRRCVR